MDTRNAVLRTTLENSPSRTTDVARWCSTIIAFVCVMAVLLLAPRCAVAAGVREDHPNLVGGELLGRGFILTVNYERFLTNHIGLGGGIMAVGASGGAVGVAPLYISMLTGNEHSLYLSAGAAIVGGAGSLHDYESAWIMQWSVGYQYQSKSGFFIRPLFTFNQSPSGGSVLLWPGMTIGGSF